MENYKLVLTKEEIDEGVQRVADDIERRFKGTFSFLFTTSELIVPECTQHAAGEKIVLCGILKGAFVFITDLCRRLRRPYSIYFVEASSYKGSN